MSKESDDFFAGFDKQAFTIPVCPTCKQAAPNLPLTAPPDDKCNECDAPHGTIPLCRHCYRDYQMLRLARSKWVHRCSRCDYKWEGGPTISELCGDCHRKVLTAPRPQEDALREAIDPLEEGDVPVLYQRGWNDCMDTLKRAGVDAETIIAEHTRKILQQTFDSWAAAPRQDETPETETR